MNYLVPINDRAWRLPNHARVVVYEREGDERGLLTIYACGATQRSPLAQLLGILESVDTTAEIESTPTGRVVTLSETATLERTGANRYRITAS